MDSQKKYVLTRQKHDGTIIYVEIFYNFMNAVRRAWAISGAFEEGYSQDWDKVPADVQKEYIEHCQSNYSYTRIIECK